MGASMCVFDFDVWIFQVPREKLQLKESILVEFKEFLCWFVDVWWIGGIDLLVSSQF